MEISKIIRSRDLISYIYTGVKSQEKILNKPNAQTVLREVLVGATKTSSKTVFEVENGKITKNVSPIAVWRNFEI